MSADNAIVVGKFTVNGTMLFSVVETSALDNFDYYKNQDFKEYAYYVYDVMGGGQFFLDENAALKKAHIYNDSRPTEYGVKSMDFTDIPAMGVMISFVENRKGKNKKVPKPLIEEPMETMGIFKGLKAACNEETTEQTQLWMVYKVHGMWDRQEITDNQLAVLIDEILRV